MGSQMVKRAYRYRFYPTPEQAEQQAEQLSKTFGCVRYVYDGPPTDVVGVDTRITSLITLSTGEKVTNPHERADRERLARAQRARVHGRIADRRRDFLHKLSTRIIRGNQTVVIEDLTVRNMVKNHTLPRAISDVAWRQLRAMLEYKAAWYSRNLVVVDRWFPSSKACSDCGTIIESLPLRVREWTCPGRGVVHDRDVNASRTLRAAGLAVLACGDGVRPPRS
ncbi:MAG TPA: RNA-guided endonuclease TnpB family protein [Mycobacteriales bacterium]|nr:RNA-guided endonuclease TnpB family protein [Mycobacteriales bacterium]